MIKLLRIEGSAVIETLVDTSDLLAVQIIFGGATYEITQADPSGGITISTTGKLGERLHIRPNSGNTITLMVKPE